jgi:hypothetical protein
MHRSLSPHPEKPYLRASALTATWNNAMAVRLKIFRHFISCIAGLLDKADVFKPGTILKSH